MSNRPKETSAGAKQNWKKFKRWWGQQENIKKMLNNVKKNDGGCQVMQKKPSNRVEKTPNNIGKMLEDNKKKQVWTKK